MFQRTYKVSGEDVNDFMVMQNAAYLGYSSKLVETFLFVKGFTKLKMNTLKVGLQKINDQVIQHKQLFFTQIFSAKLEFKEIGFCEQKMNIAIHFYNDKQELSATVLREIYWFDYAVWQTISPPKSISKYFLTEEAFSRVG